MRFFCVVFVCVCVAEMRSNIWKSEFGPIYVLNLYLNVRSYELCILCYSFCELMMACISTTCIDNDDTAHTKHFLVHTPRKYISLINGLCRVRVRYAGREKLMCSFVRGNYAGAGGTHVLVCVVRLKKGHARSQFRRRLCQCQWKG